MPMGTSYREHLFLVHISAYFVPKKPRNRMKCLIVIDSKDLKKLISYVLSISLSLKTLNYWFYSPKCLHLNN